MTKKGPRSEGLWKQIRAEWERGASKKELAAKYDLTVQAIYNHEKKDGWELNVAAVIDDLADDELYVAPPAADPDEASARIAELEAQVAQAAEDAAAKEVEYSTTVEVPIPSSPQEWIDFLGEEKLNDIVENTMSRENQKRFRDGKPALDIHDNPELYEATKQRILAKRAAALTKYWSPTYNLRNVKVQKPNGGQVQIPVEEQINNEKGAPGNALAQAKAKGFKLMTPFRCQAYNCWMPAAVGPTGKFTLHGYCCEEHLAADPYAGKKPIEGVITSGTAGL
jgi:hypothetical protein